MKTIIKNLITDNLLIKSTLLANAGNVLLAIQNIQSFITSICSIIVSLMTVLTMGIQLWKTFKKKDKDNQLELPLLIVVSFSLLLTSCNLPLTESVITTANSIETLAKTDPVKAAEIASANQEALLIIQNKQELTSFLVHSSFIGAAICFVLSILAFAFAYKTRTSYTPAVSIFALAILASGFSFVATSSIAIYLGVTIILASLLAIGYAIYSEIKESKNYNEKPITT